MWPDESDGTMATSDQNPQPNPTARAESAVGASDDRDTLIAALLKGISDSTGDTIYAKDRMGRMLFVNPAALALIGKSADQVLGKTDAEFLDDKDAAKAVMENDRIIMESGKAADFDEVVPSTDGTRRVWLSRKMPNRDADGNVIGLLGLSRDITALKNVESALRESELQHRAILSALDEGVALHDDKGTIIKANASAERILGLTLDQICGRNSFDPRWRALAENGDELSGADHPPQIALRTRRPVRNFIMAVHRPDDTPVWVSVNSIPLLDPGTGGVTGIVTSFFDITEKKNAERERERLLESERAARSEAERAGRMKDEFLATLSHELRTPLNAILGWATILAGQTPTEADLKDGLETIQRNARAQTQIIEDLLDMSRIISGKIRLDVQRTDLADVLRASVETVRPAAEAKGVRLRSVLDPQAGPVTGDGNRLQQVFWNLLTNALKFTPRGGQVQVALERVNSHVEVSIADTGEGIAPEFLPHVFDRFRQADASTSRRHGGLGLGLAIVKQLVELHGGSVRVKSPGTGKGSTFTVALPLTVLHPEAETKNVTRRHPQAPTGSHANDEYCPQLAGVRVVVVDDEPDARALVKRLLEDCKAVVRAAASADEAIELIQAEPPDVLVSDIGMPGRDGYAMIRHIRRLEKQNGGGIPAIALTAYARTEDRVKAIRAGYQSHVVKPVEPTELITVVASLAGRMNDSD
jgi:PAS domain S-box-containing protein